MDGLEEGTACMETFFDGVRDDTMILLGKCSLRP